MKQKYLDEVTAIIGLDMAVPGVYLHWNQEEIDQRIRFMKRMRRLNDLGLLFWYPLSRRGLNRNEIKQQHLLRKRNAMNPCYENEAKAIIENGFPIESGEAIDSMDEDGNMQMTPQWTVQYEDSIVEPLRTVLDIHCGEYAGGNR